MGVLQAYVRNNVYSKTMVVRKPKTIINNLWFYLSSSMHCRCTERREHCRQNWSLSPSHPNNLGVVVAQNVAQSFIVQVVSPMTRRRHRSINFIVIETFRRYTVY